MTTVDAILLSIGGSSGVLLIAAFLGRSWMEVLVSKALETHKAQLDQQSKAQERAADLAVIMMHYQGPFLWAVYDLQSRLYNIIANNLIGKYWINGDEYERDYVVNHTVFVLGQYFAWSEIIRHDVQFIDCQDRVKTARLSDLKHRIYHLFQTDELPGRFRLWSGEQRAVGEALIEVHDGKRGVMGYGPFLERLALDTSTFFLRLKADVESLATGCVDTLDRLSAIQHALVDMLDFLDPDCQQFDAHHRLRV